MAADFNMLTSWHAISQGGNVNLWRINNTFSPTKEEERRKNTFLLLYNAYSHIFLSTIVFISAVSIVIIVTYK